MSIPAAERKAVLDLFPYFSKQPVIFDVGSNKGFWTDVLVSNVHWAFLFEPNENLLTYTKVKYDYLKNVYYHNLAVYKKTSQFPEVGIIFYYFTNENNGLSSVYDNPAWDHLPKQKKHVQCITIDDFCKEYEVPYIDFLKIDIEGADMDALLGANKMLKKKRILFIQVEKSEHLNLSGHIFDDIIEYLASFGYYPLETQDKENVIFAMEGFTQDWNTEFKKNTQGIKVDFALEIGCFEGLTSRYICDNLLNPGGRIICVDPLTDEYLPGHPDNEMFVGQYERFTRNTKGYPVELIRKKSSEVYDQMKDYRFGFIYVDGDHTEEAVYQDAYLAFNLCLLGGKILFDDYQGYREETTIGIDRFLKEIPPNKMTVQKLGYQVMVTKHENLI